jgi:ribosomal subunit interface protein
VLLPTDRKGFLKMDIVFKGRHTDVLERFRKHATPKLTKLAKLDQKAIRIDVEVTAEHNPRQSGRRERVELTITTRGPAIRAEAAAEDRFAALDLALAKLEGRLRRACDRRKSRHAAAAPARPELVADGAAPASLDGLVPQSRLAPGTEDETDHWAPGPAEPELNDVVAVPMEGDGPMAVREKFHVASPMPLDQALFEMELVGHDFFLFTDERDGLPSVVYRRRGYQYGVIRLVEEIAPADGAVPGPEHRAGAGLANGQSAQAANLASG